MRLKIYVLAPSLPHFLGNTECKLFLSVICPSAASVGSWHLSTIRHNQDSEVPQQLPGRTLEVVTYNVNLEIWTTAQREAEKVSLQIFSA